ncbi:hypothetical protein ACFX1Q_018787 [Malus domestica]
MLLYPALFAQLLVPFIQKLLEEHQDLIFITQLLEIRLHSFQILISINGILGLGNEPSGTGPDLDELALTEQVADDGGSLQLRFRDEDQVIAFDVCQQTFVHESSRFP